MQLRRKSGRARNDDDSVLPLINVVFLLLIFFMLAGHLAAGDPFVIEPPKSQSEGQNTPQDMLILVSADGRFALDGVEMSEEALIEAATQRLQLQENTEDVTLRLKTDGGTPANRIVELMQRLRQAGFKSLKLLTIPKS